MHVVTVGFDGGQALLAGQDRAFTGFIPDDGVQLQVSGHPITAFALDRNGGPAYPGLVAFTTRGLIALRPGAGARLRGGDRARLRGHAADPARSLDELLRANPTLPREVHAPPRCGRTCRCSRWRRRAVRHAAVAQRRGDVELDARERTDLSADLAGALRHEHVPPRGLTAAIGHPWRPGGGLRVTGEQLRRMQER